MGKLLWAFFFAASVTSSHALAEDAGMTGAVTYPPKAATAKPSIAVPTPDTIPPPTGLNGTATNTSIPNSPTAVTSAGKYRNAKGEVKIEGLIHDRYKQSVVRVTAKDLAGNVLARAMGVAVGRGTQYIAAPLSLVLGSSQQWADRIEITHFAGNKYEANVALIDEEKNLVILAPEASPAPIVFAAETDERPQVDVFTISFENAPDGSITSSVHRGRVAAANTDTGLLSVSPYSGQVMDDAQAGTGLIDSDGKLIGMLLPGGRGVLSSTLQRSIAKAQKATPIEPRLIGVILGRGVLVDPKSTAEGSFKTISDALDAIKKGAAPKTDPTRYTPARNRAVAPKDTDKVVIKVMPGTYKEKKPITLPSDTSLSGSGPGQTTIVAPDPGKPAILIQNANNVIVAGFRIVPANLQSLKAPALIVSKATGVTLIGNVFEAKGGVGAWVHDSMKVSFFGNTFARGTIRALSCDKTSLQVEANAFVGDWPVALSLDKDCSSVVKRNLFIDNKTSIGVASTSGSTMLQENSFIRDATGVKLSGASPSFTLYDSLFFETPYGFISGGDINTRNLGRNATWKSKFMSRSKPL
ncbi:MAG: right-handed parallel beta-helix repeat-containing protein, partial [Bdellovibrionota bacterium]